MFTISTMAFFSLPVLVHITYFWYPSGRNIEIAAIIYGSGIALTCDDFGM